MRYKGTVSALWWAITVAAAALSIYYIGNIALSGGADALSIGLCFVPVAITCMLAWTILGNFVELGESGLRICVGPFRLRVAYADITQVSEYRLEGAVIALALGRNRVTAGRRNRASVVVSVEDAESFMDELRSRAGC